MRAISADNAAILAGLARKASVRLSVLDPNGIDWRDLTNYAQGEDMLKSLVWRDDVDAPSLTWEAGVTRESELLSYAPGMTASGLNRGFNVASTYAALVQQGRQVKVEWRLQPEDDPGAGSWVLAFLGWIDSVDPASADGVMAITGRGAEAPLMDCYIERERIYAYAQGVDATKGLVIFEPSTAYVIGDRVIPSEAKTNGHFYKVTVSGSSAATEPTWPTGGAGTVVNGTATFAECGTTSTSTGTAVETVMQQLLNDNGFSAVVLNVPTSPAWAVKWFNIGRQPLFDELRALADQIGWCIRYVWDAGSLSLKLTLYDPNRSNTVSAHTFPVVEQLNVGRALVEVFDIRNAVQVVYSDSQDLDSAKIPKRKKVLVTDATSITKYGRRFCEVAEGSASNIDTSGEATTLANSILSDLKDPVAAFDVSVPFFPFVELADLYTFSANGVHFDGDQKLAVTSYEHAQTSDEVTSTIHVRGSPSSASDVWLQKQTDAAGQEVHALTVLDASTLTAAAQTGSPVGGASGSFQHGGGKGGRDVKFELHLSTTSGFTPDSTTLKSISSERSFNFGDLDPAKVHYGVLIPVVFNGSRRTQGLPSEQFTVTPGRAMSTHLNPNVIWGKLPLNGGFETQFDTNAPPDFWYLSLPAQWNGPAPVVGGLATLGTSSGVSGANYVKLKTTSSTAAVSIFSAEFTINELSTYLASMWKKNVSGTGNNLLFVVAWYDLAHALISSDSTGFSLTEDVGTWKRKQSATFTPPSGARFARLNVSVDAGAANREVHIDSVEFSESGGVVGAGGADTQVQFNDGGSLAGDSAFLFTKTNKQLSLASAGNGSGFSPAIAGHTDTVSEYGVGLYGYTAIHGSANLSREVGIEGDLYHGGSGTLDLGLGFYVYIENDGAGIISKAVGYLSDAVYNVSTGSVANAIGFAGFTQSAGAAANFHFFFGLDESDITKIAVLRCQAEGPRLGLGTDDPKTRLHIGQGLITYGATDNITAHAGGGQASAVALTNQVNFVTTVATDGDSVKLPQCRLGARVVVFNLGAKQLAVFPASGAAIEALGANNAYTLTPELEAIEFFGQTATEWRLK